MFTIPRTRLLAGAATLALTASLGATPGLAQETAIGTMQVTASVDQSCEVTSDGPINFPAPTSGGSSVGASAFTVNCTADDTVQVVLTEVKMEMALAI